MDREINNNEIILFSELPVESAETQGELQMLYTTPVTEWNAHLVEIFFKLHLKMSESFSTQAAQQIKSGKVRKTYSCKLNFFKKYRAIS